MSNIQRVQPFLHAFGSYPHVCEAMKELPSGKQWIDHINDDLMPYWVTSAALGNPAGAFPTYRYNDGSLVDFSAPKRELTQADPGVVDLKHPVYTRMHGRQTFAYGVAFHMTGEQKYLDYAKLGVDYFLGTLADKEKGKTPVSAFTYLDQSGKPGPEPRSRRSQDLAYALCGIGFYYYLTRDPDVLEAIVSIKNNIFEKYYDADKDLILWALTDKENEEGDSKFRKELVAQLDQVYAYLLFVAPTLGDRGLREQWFKDLGKLGRIMVNQFYSPRTQLFWGTTTDACDQRFGAPHTDFGHSVKTFWLLHQLGKLTSDSFLTQFTAERITQILDAAYVWEDGTWSRGFRVTGDIDPDKEWWIYAELDQAASTLALVDPSYSVYLPRAYKYWFDVMVDDRLQDNPKLTRRDLLRTGEYDKSRPVIGEIWHYVDAGTNQPNSRYPKQHSWKNAFHSTEHALVAYVTTQQIRREPITLHYAFQQIPEKHTIQPYTFRGRISGEETIGGIQRYEFKDVR